jgi:hypothetical protein
MTTRRAECTCGQLSATCSGEPTVAVCHCLACKRRSGSAFSFNAWFGEADVATAGEAREFVRVGDEGSRLTFSFCPTCGVTVFYRNDQFAGAVGVVAGAFADLDFPAPTVSVYHESRGYPWLEITADPLQKLG